MNKRDLIKLLTIAAVLVLAVLLVTRIDRAQDSAETELVYNAIKNAALTCYAVEGMYPDDLNYLIEHYNLSYNKDRYIVYYEPLASNVIPSIKVVERGNTDL